MQKEDKELLAKLEEHPRPIRPAAAFEPLVTAFEAEPSARQLSALASFLEEAGAFSIPIETRDWPDSSGKIQSVSITRAAHTPMWPMGTHWWARDNTLIAVRFIEAGQLTGDTGKVALGKRLLLSALTIMSSRAQLKRFENIISSRDPAFRNNPHNWPHIFLEIAGNLNAAKVEPWAHKQDAWQMLAYYTLMFLEAGVLTEADLTDNHRSFFKLLAPFLATVEYWHQESSGSWEEITAVRTSVLAWETLLLAALERHGYAVEPGLLDKGIASVMRQLPYESPGYPTNSPRYREADAALIYLLQLEYPHFLADRLGRGRTWADKLEQQILEQIRRLDDLVSGGIRRYQGDSYQRVSFFRNTTAQKLQALYGKPSGDASGEEHFTGRDKVVPAGREAAWTHFVWQLAAWSARHKEYRALHQEYLHRGLRLLTGDREISVAQRADGGMKIINLPSLRFPECYITEILTDGSELVFPSPHTPLNWAVAEAATAFAQLRAFY